MKKQVPLKFGLNLRKKNTLKKTILFCYLLYKLFEIKMILLRAPKNSTLKKDYSSYSWAREKQGSPLTQWNEQPEWSIAIHPWMYVRSSGSTS